MHSFLSFSRTKLFLLVVLHIVEFPISPSFVPIPGGGVPLNSLETKLTSAKFGFLANLRSAMDQLSSDAPDPLFDPKGSTSFEMEYCINTQICDGTGAVKLTDCSEGRCSYIIRYGDGHARGYLARETFDLGTSQKDTGILGLAANRLSLVSQLNASKFSYCFGNISDRSYPYSFFGIGDYIGGFQYKTRLIIEGKYYINLESIKIGSKFLEVDPQIFRRISADYTGGMIVDTGSTDTFIPQVVINKFENEVINLIHSTVPRNHSILTYKGYTRLCYNGVLTRDLQRFPKVHFTFEGKATMMLTPENVFHQLYADTFCLGIHSHRSFIISAVAFSEI
ncbi:hypothetical protein OROHE_026771 [Orobanche hederae]